MPRPTEAQVTLYHVPLKDYPEHGPGTFRYPRPRKRKGAPLTAEEIAAGELPALPSGGLPQIHIWAFEIGVAVVNTRTTVVSDSYQLPLMIDDFVFKPTFSGGDEGGIALLYSPDNTGAVTNGAAATLPPGLSIFDTARQRSTTIAAFFDPLAQSFPTVSHATGFAQHFISTRPRLILPGTGQIFLKVTIAMAGGAGNIDTQGYVRVIEADTIEALRLYL